MRTIPAEAEPLTVDVPALPGGDPVKHRRRAGTGVDQGAEDVEGEVRGAGHARRGGSNTIDVLLAVQQRHVVDERDVVTGGARGPGRDALYLQCDDGLSDWGAADSEPLGELTLDGQP